MPSVRAGTTVALITNAPTPYRIPLFNELSRQLSAIGVELVVIFAALGYSRRKWSIDVGDFRFRHVVLPTRRVVSLGPEHGLFTYPGLLRTLRRISPALVVVAGFGFATVKVWARSWWRRTPFLIWSGAIEAPADPDSWFRRVQRRIVLRRAAGAVAYGKKARDYLVNRGAAPERVQVGINTVEVNFFAAEGASPAGDVRESEQSPRIVSVGYLVRRKRVDQLLEVIRVLAEARRDFIVDVVGGGPEEPSLRQMAENMNIAALVQFHGNQQRAQIRELLRRGSCFVFPTSHDVWGLTLVEAMAVGLPCLASIHAGATSDLVRDGENGFAVDFGDSERTADRLEWLLKNPVRAREMGAAAQRLVLTELSVERSAAGFVRAISDGLDGSLPGGVSR